MARILLVDDQENVRLSVAGALRGDGHEVTTSEASPAALDLLRAEPYDLLLLPLRLAGSAHPSALKEARAAAPQTSVVVLGSQGSVEEAVEAIRSGARDYLPKPCAAEQVVDVVRRTLGSGSSEVATPAPLHRSRYSTAFSDIVGKSPAIEELLELVGKVAVTGSTVLITGETGTGKELIGRAIHEGSSRRNRVFCAINSAAFPETLLESELFGHRRGSFTGASSNKKGLFEYAHQGTVFLDEVAEMPLSMQAKLLRFLQTGEIRPVGGESTRCVDVRLVTATNKDLEEEVKKGRFREDLYYRLAVIPIHVPPLRDRREDIPLLAHHFRRRFAAKLSKRVDSFEPDALDVMLQYAWPGNVRELENSVERGVALCRGLVLTLGDLPARLREPAAAVVPENLQSLETLERTHILKTLERVGWNRRRAAEILQISTTTLWRRLKEFGVDAPGMGAGRF